MAVTFTKLRSSANNLVYSYTTAAGAPDTGTLAFSTILADAFTGPLATALAAVNGQTDSNAKAVAAMITGAAFTSKSGPVVTSFIQTAIAPSDAILSGVAAVDSGGSDSPDILVSVANTTSGTLRIAYNYSVIR